MAKQLRNLTTCNRVAERGRQLIVPWSLSDVSYSVTCCTDLTNPMGFVMSTPRTESNTALDFLEFVIELVQNGTLVAGDFFIVDNASIHGAAEIMPALNGLLDAAHVRLVFLPSYSPELNPTECIFGKAKTWLRNHRGFDPFIVEVVKAFAEVTWHDVLAFYERAIDHYDQ